MYAHDMHMMNICVCVCGGGGGGGGGAFLEDFNIALIIDWVDTQIFSLMFVCKYLEKKLIEQYNE